MMPTIKTEYPWTKDLSSLPNNYSSALPTLKSCEKTPKRDRKRAEVYSQQLQDMVDRRLLAEEIDRWSGPVFYMRHLAVWNPKPESTPVRHRG